MALSLLLGGLLALRVAAEPGPKEKRLKLDLQPFDAHLARVDACVRALPEVTGAKAADCLAFEDAALARCTAAYGDALNECMTQSAEAKADKEAATELLPELKKLREDLIHCYDKEGIRPLTVQKLSGPLKRCGIVYLHKVLPEEIMESAEEHMRRFVAHREDFHDHHPGHEASSGQAEVHDLPTNLEGGRYEIVPPHTSGVADLVHWMTHHFNTPRIASSIWGDDHNDQAQLAYLVVRSQLNDTKLVVDQPFHQDRDTCEDIRVQVAVHATGADDGPMEVLPTSHRLHTWLRAPDSAFPRARRLDKVKTGDVVLHFSRIRHRGTKRKGRVPRTTLDMVLHSTGRKFHEESERDPLHVERKLLKKEAPKAAMDSFKELWAATSKRNRDWPEL